MTITGDLGAAGNQNLARDARVHAGHTFKQKHIATVPKALLSQSVRK